MHGVTGRTECTAACTRRLARQRMRQIRQPHAPQHLTQTAVSLSTRSAMGTSSRMRPKGLRRKSPSSADTMTVRPALACASQKSTMSGKNWPCSPGRGKGKGEGRGKGKGREVEAQREAEGVAGGGRCSELRGSDGRSGRGTACAGPGHPC